MSRPHPRGYPIAEDSPAFIAPPLELRQAVEAVRIGDVEEAVEFTLSFPIIEREREAALMGDEAAAFSGEDPDTLEDMPAVDPERTLERDPYGDGEVTLQGSEHDLLIRSLSSIGALDETPDVRADRPNTMRVLLARARATRSRVALLEVWPDDLTSPRAPRADVSEELLDLAIHPAVIVALADGFPSDPATSVGRDDVAILDAIARDVRARMPAVDRSTLRDVVAAAFARVTLLGTKKAIEYVHGRFSDVPGRERRAALTVAAALASNDDRATAQRMLEAALS